MINLILLTTALISLPESVIMHKVMTTKGLPVITLSHSITVVSSTPVNPEFVNNISEGLSMEIRSNLEAVLERMLSEMDEELINDIKSDSAITLYSHQD